MAQISISFLVNIDFDYGPGPFTFLLFFVKNGSHLFTWIAPRGTELNDTIILTLDGLFKLFQILDLRIKPSQKIEVSQKHFN
jgi:hypothetical protein